MHTRTSTHMAICLYTNYIKPGLTARKYIIGYVHGDLCNSCATKQGTIHFSFQAQVVPGYPGLSLGLQCPLYLSVGHSSSHLLLPWWQSLLGQLLAEEWGRLLCSQLCGSDVSVKVGSPTTLQVHSWLWLHALSLNWNARNVGTFGLIGCVYTHDC